MADPLVLTLSCADRPGITARVTSFLFERGGNILEAQQFNDRSSDAFFMRVEFDPGEASREMIRTEFAPIAAEHGMDWKLALRDRPRRVLIMVSKFDHCLSDLMYRQAQGELDMEITAIVSNHRDLRPMAEREGIRFVYLPVTKETKAKQEAALMDIVEETGTELVVLARYMQILSDNLCRQLSGRAINIHHSFLPGFKGAKPYHQAHTRGVKLIGATAHYVTSDLDEGPIIDQEVQRVNHTYRPEDLVAVGRNTETIALSRAVKYHLEHRIFLDQNKTVIFQ